jgi:predicted GIY-YIG superfamily endonuclease
MLKLKYEVTGSAKSIHYSNEFEVKGWSKEQKDQLVTKIIDSLENNAGKTRDYLHKKIEDDGTKMKVTIEGRRDSNVISYNKSFDVKGMTQEQKNAIVDELVKSLGLSPKQQ